MDNKNRVYNLQWAGARNYEITPFMVANNIDGNPDFYLNFILGLSSKYLGASNIINLLDEWKYNYKRNKYDLGLIYLLEDFSYQKELPKRPVLKDLRKAYAEKFLEDKYDLNRRKLALSENLIFRLKEARAKEILNINPKLKGKYKAIYENFSLPMDTDGKNLKTKVIKLFKDYLSYKENYLLRSLPGFGLRIFDSVGELKLERSNKPSDFKEDKDGDLKLFSINFRKKTSNISRIERTFGPPLFDENIRLGIERDLCTGGHKKSKLYFTKGIEKDNKKLDQELNNKAIKRHLLKFKENKSAYESSIKVLSKSIKLRLNQVSATNYTRSRSGRLIPSLAYKAEISDGARIFSKKSLSSRPSFVVDLLVDGSASLLDRESEVAIEAYILAKSLENNSIKNRLIAFQTVGEYTILSVLKDYDDKATFDKVFRFKSIGRNRDGLALKAYRALLKGDYKRLSLVLSDLAPSDLRAYVSEGFSLNKPYEGKVGLKDTKESLDFLRKKGTNLGLILNSDNINQARDLYRDKFIKIKDPQGISSAGASFINREIKNLNTP